jgi:hypothetical protein
MLAVCGITTAPAVYEHPTRSDNASVATLLGFCIRLVTLP